MGSRWVIAVVAAAIAGCSDDGLVGPAPPGTRSLTVRTGMAKDDQGRLATVVLDDGTRLWVGADAAGVARFDDVTPGPHDVTVESPDRRRVESYLAVETDEFVALDAYPVIDARPLGAVAGRVVSTTRERALGLYGAGFELAAPGIDDAGNFKTSLYGPTGLTAVDVVAIHDAVDELPSVGVSLGVPIGTTDDIVAIDHPFTRTVRLAWPTGASWVSAGIAIAVGGTWVGVQSAKAPVQTPEVDVPAPQGTPPLDAVELRVFASATFGAQGCNAEASLPATTTHVAVDLLAPLAIDEPAATIDGLGTHFGSSAASSFALAWRSDPASQVTFLHFLVDNDVQAVDWYVYGPPHSRFAFPRFPDGTSPPRGSYVVFVKELRLEGLAGYASVLGHMDRLSYGDACGFVSDGTLQ